MAVGQRLPTSLACEAVLVEVQPVLGDLRLPETDGQEAAFAGVGLLGEAALAEDLAVVAPLAICLPLEGVVTHLAAEVLLVPAPPFCPRESVRHDQLKRTSM